MLATMEPGDGDSVGTGGGGTSGGVEGREGVAGAGGWLKQGSLPEDWDWCGSSNPPAVKMSLLPAEAAQDSHFSTADSRLIRSSNQ